MFYPFIFPGFSLHGHVVHIMLPFLRAQYCQFETLRRQRMLADRHQLIWDLKIHFDFTRFEIFSIKLIENLRIRIYLFHAKNEINLHTSRSQDFDIKILPSAIVPRSDVRVMRTNGEFVDSQQLEVFELQILKKKKKKIGSILDKQQFAIHGDVQWRFLKVKRA